MSVPNDPEPGGGESGQPPPGSESPDRHGEKSSFIGVAALAALGTTIAACEAVGVVLGLWADRSWGTAPGGLLLGIVLATVVAVVSVVKQVRRYL